MQQLMLMLTLALALVFTAVQVAVSSDSKDNAYAPARLVAGKPKLALFSKEYAQVHPDWRRGGAWMFHDDYHPCQRFGSTCTLTTAPPSVRGDGGGGDDTSRVRIHVNTTIVAHLGFVNVSFTLPEHMQHTNPKDTIAVYCAAEQEHPTRRPSDLDFFDYIYIGDARTIMQQQQRGSIVFGPLANQRCSYQFRYLQYIADLTYRSVGESALVEMERGHSEPVGIHVALTNRSDELRVMWTSGRVTAPSVLYNSRAHNVTYHAHATTSSYSAQDMCNGLARREVAEFFRHPGYLHDAVLTGLLPNERYEYRVGSADGLWSDAIAFVTPPAPGTATPPPPSAPGAVAPQSFFVFGDLGESVLVPSATEKPFESFIDGESVATRSGSVMDVLIQDLDAGEHTYVAVLHVGDISYARGRTFLWDQFGAMVQPVAARIPYMVAIGNHEYDYTSGGERDVSGAGATNGWHPVGGNYGQDSSGECGLPTAKRFHMPAAAASNGVFWYSFDLGLVHHTVISSEHDSTPGSRMHAWLKHDLRAVDRAKTPWLFLHLHRPMYCSQKYAPDYDVSLLLRRALEPLLREFHVDAVFGGHYHAYERTCAVLDGACQSDVHSYARAPVHIMVGAAGATLDDAEYWRKPWSENVQSEYGYGRVHVHNATHAQFEFVRIKGRIVTDAVWLRSTHDW